MSVVCRSFPKALLAARAANFPRSARNVISTQPPFSADMTRQIVQPHKRLIAGEHKRGRSNMDSIRASASAYSGAASDELLAVLVYVHVKEGLEEEFKTATIKNATNSVLEPGVARFDFLQEKDDPTKFVLVEVYKTPEAPAQHKETEHYKVWAQTVADMMADPRSNTKYLTKFPGSNSSWDSLVAATEGPAKDLLAVHVFIHVKDGCQEAFKVASTTNATNSLQEPGISRFDLLQQKDDQNKFVLIEVYCTDTGAAEHKETPHYAAWRDTVADMMAEPRSNIKYVNVFPNTVEGWQTLLP